MIELNELFSFFIVVFSENKITCSLCFCRVTKTQSSESFGELEKAVETLPLPPGSCSCSISCCTKLPLVFHNSTVYKGDFRDKLSNNYHQNKETYQVETRVTFQVYLLFDTTPSSSFVRSFIHFLFTLILQTGFNKS